MYNQFNYTISINFSTEKILYPSPILLGDETTSNFSNSENFVVLECVDRLLSIGYPPFSITLENKWSMGRTNKGKLDILVKDENEKSYLMIECKTWGSEYTKEKSKMLKDGGQLISYYQQDRNAQYLCLYSSRLENNTLAYENDIIKIEEDFRSLADVKEVYDRWNKQFNKNGIFNESPYQVKLKTIVKKDLRVLEKEDSQIIYHQFLEILRHNVVSDKGNAFNKIFNLFLCKVLDEDKSDEEELSFQWIEGIDNYETLLSRLNDLYKEGMKNYLEKEITDYNENDLEKLPHDEKIKQILKELRLYKNQEFAFLEVFNKKSFEENAKIVKEIVQLLQHWQIRYTDKNQFLGDFFELLLSTGFKQESGQFFTPVPLVRFILKSLPIQETIEEKIKNKEDNFLPYLIDYACGSGHFLTEAMDIIQNIINNFESKNLTGTQTKKLNIYKNSHYEWAKEFVYGIEKDYRLVKTTKLACFLHGDGEAQIIHASGIAPFGKNEYKGKLEKPEQFDLLIANPPYSVKGFKSTVKEGEKSFKLFQYITDKSGDIEVLFIERMLQLLKPNAVAGIILPSTILSNGGSYEKARELILSNFDLKAVVSIGQGGFMATGTSTVTLFLRKLENPLVLENKDDYKNLSLNKKLLVVNSGEKELEKKFLGYEFSNRRGNEGLSKLTTNLLHNENNRFDEEYTNSYILKAMLNYEDIQIHDKLKNHISIISLSDCFNWDRDVFSNEINLKKKLQIKSSKYDLVNLGDVVTIKKGNTIKKEKANLKGNIPVIAGGKTSPYNHNEYNYKGNVITIGASGEAGYVWYHDYPIWASDCFALNTKDESITTNKYVYYILKNFQNVVYNLQTGTIQKHVYEKDLQTIKIPLPPVEIQDEIINLIEEKENLISSFSSKITETIPLIKNRNFYSSKKVKLKHVCSIVRGGSPRPINNFLTDSEEGLNWIKISDATNGEGKYITSTKQKIKKEGLSSTRFVKKGTLLVSNSMTAGKTFILKIDGCIHDGWLALTIKDKTLLLQEYLYYILNSNEVYNTLLAKAQGAVVNNLNIDRVGEVFISFPSLAEQEKVVEQIEQYESEIEKLKLEIKDAKEKQRQIINDMLGLES